MKTLREREVLLTEHRRALTRRADELRAESTRLLQGFSSVFGFADRAAGALNWTRRHAPEIAGVLFFTLALRKPKQIIRSVARAWSAWQIYQNLRRRVEQVAAYFK
ncbi:MAG: YqjK-like family protein [Betaproteobacteria bacterium]|nr:YqjK-like family protein [Betaproteobacteria bacterium]